MARLKLWGEVGRMAEEETMDEEEGGGLELGLDVEGVGVVLRETDRGDEVETEAAEAAESAEAVRF
jgi:hypothetical protein